MKLDTDFTKLITRGDYKVFLTPEGNCRGLYVRKRAASFEVRELQSGTSNVAFSYRIVARRKDIKAHQRFATRAKRCPPQRRAHRASPRRQRQRCARSSPAWRGRRGSADRRARGQAEDDARLRRAFAVCYRVAAVAPLNIVIEE